MSGYTYIMRIYIISTKSDDFKPFRFLFVFLRLFRRVYAVVCVQLLLFFFIGKSENKTQDEYIKSEAVAYIYSFFSNYDDYYLHLK